MDIHVSVWGGGVHKAADVHTTKHKAQILWTPKSQSVHKADLWIILTSTGMEIGSLV